MRHARPGFPGTPRAQNVQAQNSPSANATFPLLTNQMDDSFRLLSAIPPPIQGAKGQMHLPAVNRVGRAKKSVGKVVCAFRRSVCPSIFCNGMPRRGSRLRRVEEYVGANDAAARGRRAPRQSERGGMDSERSGDGGGFLVRDDAN